MEHQVFVPAPTDRLGAALTDPARVARAVPGLHQDAGAEPVAGRLKLRVGGHSVTYRGTARVTRREDGAYTVTAEATEARGAGSVSLALTLRLADAEGGCTVTVEGTADTAGRITELPAETVASAAARLLSRFLEALATEEDPAEDPAEDEGSAEDEGPADGEGPAAHEGPATGDGPAADEHVTDADENPADGGAADEDASRPGGEDVAQPPDRAPDTGTAEQPQPPAGAAPRPSVFDTEVPPPALDPATDDDTADTDTAATGTGSATGSGTGVRGGDGHRPAHPDGLAEDFADTGEPPAEAAHARRTMIGRSAEEVDHAPPRGRYAPVPAPQAGSGHPVLRWAAPAAAVALASAIVVSRALRRRR
ncbi:SRPBCC family protein [Streptomyces sp. NPDC051132]|uniref:SRPBCC family protein n=1 Tax=unclassified Streptomyces TaxID=2593676 RepID=UPI00341D68C7